MGFPSLSLNVVFDYFSHSCPKMCKICLKRPLDATFLDCLALTFCDVIGELLPEWACLTLQGGTAFLLTSKLADIPVSRVRIPCPFRNVVIDFFSPKPSIFHENRILMSF